MVGDEVCVSLVEGVVDCVSLVEGVVVCVSLEEGVVVRVSLVEGEGVEDEVGLSLGELEGETVGEGVPLWLPPRVRLAVGVEGGVPERVVEGDVVCELLSVGEGVKVGLLLGVRVSLPPALAVGVGLGEGSTMPCTYMPAP